MFEQHRMDGGFDLFVNANDPGPVTEFIRRHKTWEPPVTEALLRVLRPEDVFVDAGAHIGYFALLAARRGAWVYAFEPDAENFAVLRANTFHEARVTRFMVALGETQSFRPLYRSSSNYGDHHLFDDGEARTSVSVPVLALDAHPCSARLSVLKMDTQGCELDILRGAARTIERQHPVILFEYYPYGLRQMGQPPVELLEWLWERGYRVTRLDSGAQVNETPFVTGLDYLDCIAEWSGA